MLLKLIPCLQIGPNIVACMPDNDLEKFIPAYGDRLKLKLFQRKKENL